MHASSPDRRPRLPRGHAWRVIALAAALTTPALPGCDDDSPRPQADVGADTRGDDTGTAALDSEVSYDGDVLEDVATCGAQPGVGMVCCRSGVPASLACVDGEWACPADHVYVPDYECGGAMDTSEPPDLGATCATCTFGEYCRFDDGRCGQGRPESACIPSEPMCEASPEPVCGCDGAVHLNPCQARADGVDLWVDGTCAPPPGTFMCGARFCQRASEYCERSGMSQGADAARCVALPDVCSESSTPDCACLSAVACGETCTGDAASGLSVQCP